ncbi:MAG: peptidyl-prolyl cis-trans isomerase, partial [Clostridiales bacterium]|nr:peptidyl-prolyl cis-trans isomerase [Clostridiales bacterium]
IANYDEVTVRHILFLYEGKEDTAAEDAATEEAEAAEAGTDGEDGAESEVEAPPARTREESKALAEDTVARINAGEDMAALVQELSEDTDLTNEGIYTFKKTDPYEQGFIDWAYDPERKVGDVGIAETSYGYHVMRLEDHTVQTFEEVKESIVDEIKTEQVDAIVEGWKTEPRFQVQVNQGVYDSMTL